MILTTSRKPGRKTRRFAKVLARFMNWNYVQRGKLSVKSSGDFAVLQEIKGNPAVLRVFRNGREVLNLRFNVGKINKMEMGSDPVIFAGKLGFDPLILGAIPLRRAGLRLAIKFRPKKKIYVRRNGKIIVFDFTYDGKTIMKLKCYESGIRVQDR